MVKMEIEVISSETITPSGPTPSHLKNFSLSLLDQTYPASYVPVIIFYPKPSCDHHSNIMTISTQLKVSLSEALSRFYPLAGRIKDHLSIDCNDQGALFAQAKVDCDLSTFLKQPKLELLHHFLPSLNVKNVVLSSAVHIAIQLNVFACGGISMGMLFLHKIIDGATMASFLKFWAAAAAAANPANIPLSMQPKDDDDLRIASKLFPPKQSIPDELMISLAPYLKVGKGVWRRFVFDAEAISSLKSNILPTLGSRLFVVSSFILKHVMVAVNAAAAASTLDGHEEGIKKHSVLSFALNMRPRMIPPLPQYSIGNLIYAVHLRIEENNYNGDMDHQRLQLQSLVALKREAAAKINYDYLTSLQGERGFDQMWRDYKERAKVLFTKEEVNNTYLFSSWCNLGFNELDFGWGKPLWVSRVANVIPGKYVKTFDLLDTVSGDGIEAWVQLSEAVMNILERDQEFLAFASLNPGIVLPRS